MKSLRAAASFGFIIRPITQLLPRRGSVVTVTLPRRSFDHETTKTTTAHHRYCTNYYQVLYSHFHPVRLVDKFIRVNINNNNKSIGDRAAAAAGYRHGYGNTGCACVRQRVNRCMDTLAHLSYNSTTCTWRRVASIDCANERAPSREGSGRRRAASCVTSP